MDQPDVAAIAARAREAGRLGLDTEFMPEGRYRPLLCLVQVVVDERRVGARPARGFDSAPLAAVLADPDDRDRRPCRPPGRGDPAARVAAPTSRNVFDTQVAAGFAGFSAQAGYNGLLHDVLKIRLPKTASFTRWDARPLTDEQLRYARGDVEHLLPLADDIRAPAGAARPARVGARGVPRRSRTRPTSAIPRRCGGGCRGRPASIPASRAVARELAAWRERTAEREDRPVGAVVRDPTVVELAKRQPTSRKRAGPDPRREPGRRASPRRRHHRRDRARQRGRADPARRGRAARHRVAGRAGDRARRVARARPRAGGRARLRADRRARRPRADRRGRAPRATTSPTCARCAAGAASWSASELLELLAGRRRLAVGPGGRIAVVASAAQLRASTAVSVLSVNRPSTPSSIELLVLGERVAVVGRVRPTCAARAAGTCSRCGTCTGGRAGRPRGRRRRSVVGGSERPLGVARDDVVLRRADAVGVARDLLAGPRASRGRRTCAGRRRRRSRTGCAVRRGAAAARAARRAARSSAFRLPTSNDCTNTRRVALVEVVARRACGRAAPRAAARSSGSTSGAWSRGRCRSGGRAPPTAAWRGR